MKTDKELLILSAKAIDLPICDHIGLSRDYFTVARTGEEWDPLNDNGQAFRLAVDLDMDVCLSPRDKEVNAFTFANGEIASACEPYGNDKHAATRRAIVRAAAAIGEAME